MFVGVNKHAFSIAQYIPSLRRFLRIQYTPFTIRFLGIKEKTYVLTNNKRISKHTQNN